MPRDGTMSSPIPDPATSRRERRRGKIHEQIIEAATRLFESKGFAATTALEIANTADVAEKTFYNHFPTKQELIAEIAQRKMGAIPRLLIEMQTSSGTTAEKLHRFCEGVADEAEKSRVFTREMLFEVIRVAQTEGHGLDRHRKVHRGIQKLFENSRDEADRDAILSEIGVAAFIGIILNWVTVPNYPLRERLRQLTDVAIQVVAQRPALIPDEEAS
jgi:AcrR family transcriptional regulator